MHLDFSQRLSGTERKTHSPVPRLLFIRVTETCNANCFMCDFAGNQTPYRFSSREAHFLVKELVESSIRHVRLTGGEPLLLEDVGRTVAIFKDAGLKVSIITNGLLLDRRWHDLAAAGLDQVVVSLDSPRSEVHDKLRKTEGLFKHALAGIAHFRMEIPSILIRVNTVVAEHNLESLPEMFDLLYEIGVNQWSLIPCKPVPNRFLENFEITLSSVRERFQDRAAQFGELHLLGNSLDMFGRTVQDRRCLVEQGRTETPQPQCEVVEWVRFLDPKRKRVFPCNCVPHRGKKSDKFSEVWNPNSWGKSALESPRKWLKQYGPTQCTGCEPLNVALGEGSINLNEDLFGF